MTSPSNFNNVDDDLQVNYPWINKILFEKLIRQDYKNNEIVAVEKYSLAPALKKGENYLSQMIRAKVDYTINNNASQIYFVIKAQLINAPESMRQNELFSREIAVFECVIPRAEKLLERIGDNTKFSAKCYESNSEKHYLVFEDLISSGYTNAVRQNGLTEDNFKSAFLILAKWHATTAILMQTDNHIMRPFDNMFSTAFYESLVKNIVKKTALFLRQCEPGYDKLASKLEAISGEIFHQIQKAHEKNSNEFNCLCHSDLWSNNIMFNDFLPLAGNVLLIDFQMVCMGSPVMDICYALFSSSDESMREKDFDDLIRYYHEQLSLILKKLGYVNEIPTLDTLHTQMLKGGIYGVPLGILGTIGRYSATNENEMELLMSESEESQVYWCNLFKNSKCREKIMFLLNYFDAKGFFDL